MQNTKAKIKHLQLYILGWLSLLISTEVASCAQLLGQQFLLLVATTLRRLVFLAHLIVGNRAVEILCRCFWIRSALLAALSIGRRWFPAGTTRSVLCD